MKIEKLSENKIRITLSHQDLVQKNIDFHSFMANSIDSQDLVFDVLDEAEKEIGFVTKNYQIRIEAIAITGGDFILTVTRSLPETTNKVSLTRKKVSVRRKKSNYKATQLVYSFLTFDDFCNFIEFFSSNNLPVTNIAKSIVLYQYKNTYYLVFKQINLNYPYLKKLYSSITEFATYKTNPDLFIVKLVERGEVIMKNNAIKTGIQYFS